MISNQDDDEFVAVRVQDPRMQNEGSWNSYVDYKIFLHTNSKAFTAKTSCVRRRYSEFVWLKKNLQKNSGLVPVPDLPGKSFFSFSNEDFLERRRRGLQVFLDNVVNMTVCLSDSQLHLFLQTQLPVGHIQDCVQGHTPYSVTDAILTYASSNRGFAQAQEDDPVKEPSLTVSYESMESPAPHQPFLQPNEIFNPELLSRGDSDPLDELCDTESVEFQHTERSSVKILQKNNHLEAVVEERGPTDVTFFVGDREDVPESLSLVEETQQRSCRIETPVEVHSPMGAGFEENSLSEEESSVREESAGTLETEKTDHLGSSGEAETEKVNLETKKCVNSEAILDFKGAESDTRCQEDVLEVVCSEKQVLENNINGVKHLESTEVHVEDVGSPEEVTNSDGQQEAEMEEVDFEPEKCANSAEILDFKDSDFKEQGTESDARSQEDVLEVVCSEKQVLENNVNGVEHVESTEVHVEEEFTNSDGQQEAEMEEVDFESEKCANSAAILDFKDGDFEEEGTESDARCEEDVLEVVCSEKQVLENNINGIEHVESTEVHVEDVGSPEEFDGEKELEESDESEVKEETTLQSETHEETLGVPEVESSSSSSSSSDDDIAQQMDQVEQEVDPVRTKDDRDEDGHSSSNESIVKVSDEESDTEDSIPAANGFMKTSPDEEVAHWSQVEASSRNILDPHMNGEDISTQEDEDLRYITDISKSLDLNSTENSDFSIIEGTPGLADGKCTEQETLSSLSLDASEETHEVEVH